MRLTWPVILLCSLACGRAPPDLDVIGVAGAGDEDGWLDLELHRGLIFAPAVIEGRETVVLIDSGAERTILSQRLADELGLQDVGDTSIQGVVGGQQGGLVSDVDVRIGSWTLSHDEVMTLDLAAVSEMLGRPIPAVVGHALFEHFVVDLDLPGERLRVLAPATFGGPPEGCSTLALRYAPRGLQIEAGVEGLAPAFFDVDTGSTGNLTLYPQFWREHGLLDGRPTSTAWAGGVGGSTTNRVGTLASFRLGEVVLTGLPVSFFEDSQAFFANSGASGNLGNGVLKRFRVIVDVSRDVLHLLPGPAVDDAFEKERAGLATLWQGDALEVVHVSPGSPAAAGDWTVGERIVAIDGQPIGADYWDGLSHWSNRPPGTRLELRLASDVTRTLVLADYY